MITLFKNRWNITAVKMAMTTFCLGSFLFLLCLMSSDPYIHCMFYTVFGVCIAVTLITMLSIATQLLMNFKNAQEHLLTFVIISMNVASALLYIYLINLL